MPPDMLCFPFSPSDMYHSNTLKEARERERAQTKKRREREGAREGGRERQTFTKQNKVEAKLMKPVDRVLLNLCKIPPIPSESIHDVVCFLVLACPDATRNGKRKKARRS